MGSQRFQAFDTGSAGFGRMVSKIWSYRRKWLKKRTSKEGVS